MIKKISLLCLWPLRLCSKTNDNCPLMHEKYSIQCHHYLNGGHCKKQDRCPYMHIKDAGLNKDDKYDKTTDTENKKYEADKNQCVKFSTLDPTKYDINYFVTDLSSSCYDYTIKKEYKCKYPFKGSTLIFVYDSNSTGTSAKVLTKDGTSFEVDSRSYIYIITQNDFLQDYAHNDTFYINQHVSDLFKAKSYEWSVIWSRLRARDFMLSVFWRTIYLILKKNKLPVELVKYLCLFINEPEIKLGHLIIYDTTS